MLSSQEGSFPNEIQLLRTLRATSTLICYVLGSVNHRARFKQPHSALIVQPDLSQQRAWQPPMAKVGSAIVVFGLTTRNGSHLSHNRLYVDTSDRTRQDRINVFRPTRADLSRVCICRCKGATVAQGVPAAAPPCRTRAERTQCAPAPVANDRLYTKSIN